MSTPPAHPKIYHILHVDRLASVVADGHIWCDAEANRRLAPGTTIGMGTIKERRLRELTLHSHPSLRVADFTPFYFCPRSVMLYLMYMANHPDLDYRGGQQPIIHLEADLQRAVEWADARGVRWAFTLSNAGSRYFEDRCDLGQLDEIDWEAVQALQWSGRQERKQAEFLMEKAFPWELVERIGVHSSATASQVSSAIPPGGYRPRIEVRRDWYYP